MKLIILALVVNLVGCATPPRFLAEMYDSNDPCQNYYNKPNYQYPSFCGAGSGKAYVTRDWATGRYLTVTK